MCKNQNIQKTKSTLMKNLSCKTSYIQTAYIQTADIQTAYMQTEKKKKRKRKNVYSNKKYVILQCLHK